MREIFGQGYGPIFAGGNEPTFGGGYKAIFGITYWVQVSHRKKIYVYIWSSYIIDRKYMFIEVVDDILVIDKGYNIIGRNILLMIEWYIIIFPVINIICFTRNNHILLFKEGYMTFGKMIYAFQ